MARGRCAGDGCGFEGSYKAVLAHIAHCELYANVYREDPDRALDPAVEFARVQGSSRNLSDLPATVKKPKRSVRRSPVEETVAREPGPVSVEVWEVPTSL